MEGNKHFSHSHSLNHHQVPEGTEITCTGCKFTGTGTVYVCWQCSFYLHENCYRASRSLKHPSHPSHPLTLVPYPTYPSNSFYCNSCKLIGTGFSYSCSNCEFDIHVQCASTVSHQNFSLPNQTPSFNPYQSSNANAQHAYMPHQAVTDHLIPNSSHFNYTIPDQTPSFNPQNATSHQTISHHPIPNNPIADPSLKQEIPSFNAPTSVYTAKATANAQSSHSTETRDRTREIIHFSHEHGLHAVNLTEEDFANCSACDISISGSGYSCTESSCNFHLHNSCFQLAQEIRHISHPKHPLTLLSTAPYEYNEFTCNACSDYGYAFTYHCSVCQYNVHVKCASLSETAKREDHQHVLQLLYSCPTKGGEYMFVCDVCHKGVQNDCWTYYCNACDFGTHPGCVNSEVQEFVDLATQLAAAQLEAKIRKKGRQAALDLFDSPGTKYKWKYDYV